MLETEKTVQIQENLLDKLTEQNKKLKEWIQQKRKLEMEEMHQTKIFDGLSSTNFPIETTKTTYDRKHKPERTYKSYSHLKKGHNLRSYDDKKCRKAGIKKTFINNNLSANEPAKQPATSRVDEDKQLRNFGIIAQSFAKLSDYEKTTNV